MVSYQRFSPIEIDVGLRNAIVAILSGIIFASGWWVIIDAASCYGPEILPHPTHAIGAVATVGFIIVNILPQHVVRFLTISQRLLVVYDIRYLLIGP